MRLRYKAHNKAWKRLYWAVTGAVAVLGSGFVVLLVYAILGKLGRDV